MSSGVVPQVLSVISVSEPELGDETRRRQLREFLMHHRERLKPCNCGLPETGRRRVKGLRRDEVAELIDVSADWYRCLESGREVRISSQVIARLARALHLEPKDELLLFELAIPELYDAVLRSKAFWGRASAS